ncbi:MAG: prepilin-type N-terminal cleavage/methylation domain-containing protein [Acidimicrobiia bacterium]|nr:prepilin-type N-terminal cleavage/methylation domain-containing protein [Acidimicrobiia bacterium]
MISKMRERLSKDEGFTLVELMVVVLIIAILIAIAIPTFLGARERAQDRAAQSNLRNALTSAKVFYVDNEDYNVVAGDLDAIEPSLTFTIGAALADGSNVGVNVQDNTVAGGDGQIITFTVASASGTTFCILDAASNGTTVANSGTYYGSDTTGATLAFTSANCAAASW